MVMLFINQFAGFIGKDFRVGLAVVPILMVANLCLGIYTNLTIWYKLTDKTYLGAMVAIGGAVLTIILNVLWIPRMGYMGAAWATLTCYAAMALVSYLLGQKYFPVPYNMTKVIAYIIAGVALWQLKVFIDAQLPGGSKVISIVISAVLLFAFAAVAFVVERRELLRVIAIK
jgi:O-antigen/teichoic acid export membrane protein